MHRWRRTLDALVGNASWAPHLSGGYLEPLLAVSRARRVSKAHGTRVLKRRLAARLGLAVHIGHVHLGVAGLREAPLTEGAAKGLLPGVAQQVAPQVCLVAERPEAQVAAVGPIRVVDTVQRREPCRRRESRRVTSAP